MIFILDEQGRFLDLNPAGLATLGYGREELIGNNDSAPALFF